MSREQEEMWDILCDLSGEDVARLFTNYYGNQILDDDFYEYMAEEGFVYGGSGDDSVYSF